LVITLRFLATGDCSERNTGTPQDRLNWKSTAHTNPFAARQRTAPIWLDTRQVRSRQCSFCRARQHGIDFARQSNEYYLARHRVSRVLSSVW
jgi:hypothetical protein